MFVVACCRDSVLVKSSVKEIGLGKNISVTVINYPNLIDGLI